MSLTSTSDGPLRRYRSPGHGVDELVDAAGDLRPHWRELAVGYERLGHEELARRQAEIRLLLDKDGVTYNLTTEERRRHLPWNLDALPLVIPTDEWRTLERGVAQRAELLDIVLDDLYGARRLLRDGLIPPAMILIDPQYARPCAGVRIPGPKQLVVAGFDLARTRDGSWTVLGHRTQAPSGAAYALENRRVLSRVFPLLFQAAGVQRVEPYARALRSALRAAAPSGVDDPVIVLLSPGPFSETAFEHASVAARLGLPLVEGADLEVREGKVWLRTVARLQQVDVILRRVDAWFSDPLELRPDSTLGVPGLLDACRAGTVSVVNTLGSGVLENAGLLAVLPSLARPLLGADLSLESTGAWWCGDAASRSHVLASLGELMVRPLSRQSLEHSHDTRLMSAGELDALRRRIEARPERWVGQERIEPSTAPMLGPGGIEGRPTVLRTFAVAAPDGYRVMTGGLARTAGPIPGAPISSRAGAVAKDVWVVGGEPEREVDFWITSDEFVPEPVGVPAARAAENMFWLGRYAERADATVRLLRVVNGRRDEFQRAPAGPGKAALTVLLETLTRVTGTFPGFVGDDADTRCDDPDSELLSLIIGEDRPGSVAHAIAGMFDAIDVLRDQLSVDTWLVVGSLRHELDRLADPDDAHEAATTVLNRLLEGLLALSGLAGESMVRDHAWHFMEAGRRLERAAQVTSLVSTALTTERSVATESLVLESVLAAGESIITYRRRHRSRARVATVLDLLLLDAGNPRSLRFQVDALQPSLAALGADLPAHPARTATSLLRDTASLLDGIDTVALATPDERGRRHELEALGVTVRDRLHSASDAITAGYFSRLPLQHRLVTPIQAPGGGPR